MILRFMKIALPEHQNVSGQGIRSEDSDIYLACAPTAVYFVTDKYLLGSVSDPLWRYESETRIQ